MLYQQTRSIRQAKLALRLGLGCIWIYEGLVPKLLVPITALERDVVAASGLIPNGFESPFIHVLGVLEVVLGLLIAAGIWLRPLCVVQAAVVASFTLIIPIAHPATLSHPFGLLSKNVPILGAIVALWLLACAGQLESHDESKDTTNRPT